MVDQYFKNTRIKHPVSKFCRELYCEINKRLWLQERSFNINISSKKITIILSNGKKLKFIHEGDAKNFISFLRGHRCLFYLDKNKIHPIDNMDCLRNILFLIIQNIIKKYNNEILHAFLRQFILSNEFHEVLAHFLEKLNGDKVPMTRENYKSSGFIAFIQDGGFTSHEPFKILGDLNFKKLSFSSNSPTDNFLQLFDYLHNHNSKSQFLSPRNVFLCSSKTHSFLIQPFLFDPIWKSNVPSSIINTLSTERINNLLEKPISYETIKKILKNFLKPIGILCFLFHYKAGFSSAKDFRIKFFDIYQNTPCVLSKFDLIFYKELTLVSLDSFEIQPILKMLFPFLNISIRLAIEITIAKEIIKYKNKHYLDALKLAYLFQSSLIKHNIYASVVELERLICYFSDLPIPWILGDLNYGKYQEAPQYVQLVMKMFMDGAVYFYREGMEERIISEEMYQSLRTLHLYHL